MKLPFVCLWTLAKPTLDHTILLHKLSHYGLDNLSLLLLTSYLSNRKQFVAFEDKNSSIQFLKTGVPQGSILGPLLFLIYINDIAESSSILNFLSYAGDTTLLGSLENLKSLKLSIDSELSNVSDWLVANKLFHKNKTIP